MLFLVFPEVGHRTTWTDFAHRPCWDMPHIWGRWTIRNERVFFRHSKSLKIHQNLFINSHYIPDAAVGSAKLRCMTKTVEWCKPDQKGNLWLILNRRCLNCLVHLNHNYHRCPLVTHRMILILYGEIMTQGQKRALLFNGMVRINPQSKPCTASKLTPLTCYKGQTLEIIPGETWVSIIFLIYIL